MKNYEAEFCFLVGISNLLKISKNMNMLNTYKIKSQRMYDTIRDHTAFEKDT